jgi:peptidyl-tRNA hydrolase, PTH1 family
MTLNIKLIVGLGNPGQQYAKTRHNAGAWFIDAILHEYAGTLRQEAKFHGYFGSVIIAEQECKLLLPTTFMNLSGQAVLAVAHFYKIPPEAILIAHDELDFLPGDVRLKRGGGANGHNGVQNIIDCLNSNDFYRLRIGIGKPLNPDMVTKDYVLQSSPASEQKQIMHALNESLELLPLLVMGKIDAAMQLANTKKIM